MEASNAMHTKHAFSLPSSILFHQILRRRETLILLAHFFFIFFKSYSVSIFFFDVYIMLEEPIN